MKKGIIRICFAFLICLVLQGGIGVAQTYAATTQPVNSAPIIVQPRADIIDWRYKFVDGKMYKRQYNYSSKEWIGEWIPVN